MARYAKFFSLGGGGGGTNNLQLPVGTILDTTLIQVQDGLGTGSPLYISTLRVGITSDSSVTTQTSSVIQATTTNANLVIAPNGTGALIADIPDGTATGGNARGTNSVDFQSSRTDSSQVASGVRSVVLGGVKNQASGQYSIAHGENNQATDVGSIAIGLGNIATARGAVALGGFNIGNDATGVVSSVTGGDSNVASGNYSTISGGQSNTASSAHSTVSGGQSNTASTGTHATVVGGNINTASGQYSVAGGYVSTASALGAVALGAGATATGTYSLATCINTFASATISQAFGLWTQTYLYGQTATASGRFNQQSDAQISSLTARREATLTTGGTTVLSLDGTGVTNLIIPAGGNTAKRMWKVKVEYVGTITTITGTATGLIVGDTVYGEENFGFKKVGITLTMGPIMNETQSSDNAIMDTCALVVTAGASQEMALTFTGPTFAGGGSVTMRVVAKVALVEVAF